MLLGHLCFETVFYSLIPCAYRGDLSKSKVPLQQKPIETLQKRQHNYQVPLLNLEKARKIFSVFLWLKA